METQFGQPIERCKTCNASTPLGTMLQHTYNVHPTLIRNNINCTLCQRTLKDPIKIPMCKHPTCFCLLCFFNLILAGKSTPEHEELACPMCKPICITDLREMTSHIHSRCAKAPDYVFNDILPIDLEPFIDAKKANQVARRVLKNEIQHLNNVEKEKLQSMHVRQQKLMSIQFEKLLEELQCDQKSLALIHQTANDRIALKKKKEQQKKTPTKNQSLQSLSQSQSLHTVAAAPLVLSLSLLKRQQHKAAQMKSQTTALLALQRKAKRNKDRRQLDRLQAANKKTLHYERTTTNVQEHLFAKQQEKKQRLKVKQHKALLKKQLAESMYQQQNERQHNATQHLLREAELRCEYQRERKKFEHNKEQDKRNAVRVNRQLKLKELRKMQMKKSHTFNIATTVEQPRREISAVTTSQAGQKNSRTRKEPAAKTGNDQ